MIEFVVVDDVDFLRSVVLHDFVVEVVAPKYLIWQVGGSNLK